MPFWVTLFKKSVESTMLANPPVHGVPAKSFSVSTIVSITIAVAVEGGLTAPNTRVVLSFSNLPRTSTRTAPIPPSLCGGVNIGSQAVNLSCRVAESLDVIRELLGNKGWSNNASGRAAR